MKRLVLAALILVSLSGADALAQAQSGPPYRMNVGGASAGGLWSAVGLGIDQAVAAAYPGSTITYQTSGGGFANMPLVSKGQLPIGIALDAELDVAIKGEDPYKEPIKNLRQLVRLYDWQVNYMLLTKDFADKHGIRTMADLVAKKPPVRVGINRRGNATGKISIMQFEALGVTMADIEKWGGQVVYAASGEQTTLLMDRRIDMIANGLFLPDRSILQATNSVEMIWLDMPEDALRKVAEQTAGATTVIKAGAGGYTWLKEDVRTTKHGAILLANETMDDATAYNITKALVTNIDKIRSQNKAMEALTVQLMAVPTVTPFHPGAAKYLKEAGLLK
ncbi:MAG: TAXI family TRAP transporter solute-binding subunit [Rhodospirillales bacterium]|nr:TAXI family TRAP transporter solute-binding subunit [Rhodospirillales bacterium]